MKQLTYNALSTVAGIGAAVARVVALRGTAAGWEKLSGETPPGVAA
jgi:hypothetical protein